MPCTHPVQSPPLSLLARAGQLAERRTCLCCGEDVASPHFDDASAPPLSVGFSFFVDASAVAREVHL